MPLARPLLRLTAIAPVVLALLCAAGSAGAGEYVVTGCHGPGTADAAWAPSASSDGASTGSSCANGDDLSAAVTGPADDTDQDPRAAGWTFTAPADTTLVGVDLSRTASASDDTYAFTTFADDTTVDRCTGAACDGLTTTQTWRTPPPGATSFGFAVGCPAQPATACTAGGAGDGSVEVGALHLWDASPPLVGAPSGDLLDPAGAPAGTMRDLVVSGTDRGSGLYAASLEVDGTVRGTWSWTGGAPCAAPFTVLVPCPLAGSRSIAFDTSGLATGAHTARVLVQDASGGTGASSPFTITVTPKAPGDPDPAPELTPTPTPTTTPAPAMPAVTTNPTLVTAAAAATPAVIVAPADRLTAALPGERLAQTVSFGTRIVLRGWLVTAAGAARAGAVVTLQARVAAPGVPAGRWAAVATATTGAAGRFTVTAPAGPSRELRVIAGAATSATTRVHVRARATLVVPPTARRGQTVLLRGTVAGGARTLVQLQARDAGVWRTFATARTGAAGAFRLRYVFRSPGPAARYALRVQVPAQTGFPYLAVAGTPRRISVR